MQNIMNSLKNKEIKLISFDAFDTLLSIQRNHWLDLLISRIDTNVTPFNTHIAHILRKRLLCENTPALQILQEMQLIVSRDIPLVESRIKEEQESIHMFLFADEMIQELRKKYEVAIAIISNLGKDYGAKALHEIGPVDYTLLSYEIGHMKPGQEIFEKLVTMAGVEPQEVLHIGNGYKNDYLGAINAGMQAIHLDLKNERKADNYITHICDVANILL